MNELGEEPNEKEAIVYIHNHKYSIIMFYRILL